jgi:hypothetical protein
MDYGAIIKAVLDFLVHSLQRFWSVFLIGAVILAIGLWVRGYKANIYNNGYKTGYSQCMKDHPTQSGTIYNSAINTVGVEVYHWGFGFWHRR